MATVFPNKFLFADERSRTQSGQNTALRLGNLEPLFHDRIGHQRSVDARQQTVDTAAELRRDGDGTSGFQSRSFISRQQVDLVHHLDARL